MKHITSVLALYLGIVVLSGAIAISCHADCTANPNDPSCVAGSVVEQCTASSVEAAVTKYGPQVEQLIANTPRLPDGSVDWSKIELQIEQDVASAGMCAIAQIFSKYIFHTGPATVAGTPPPSSSDAKGEFDRLRAKFAPGKSFKTSNGVIAP